MTFSYIFINGDEFEMHAWDEPSGTKLIIIKKSLIKSLTATLKIVLHLICPCDYDICHCTTGGIPHSFNGCMGFFDNS